MDHASPLEQVMNGDINLDGITDLVDWHILRTNHPNGSTLNLAAFLGPSAPEPNSVLLLILEIVAYQSARARNLYPANGR